MNERFDTAAAITAFMAALAGGAFSLFRNNNAESIAAVIAGLFMSGFAGLLCWLACNAINLSPPLTAICTGLAGHIGAELIKTIDTRRATNV